MGTAYAGQRAGNFTRTSDNADSPWHDGGAQTALASYPGAADATDTAEANNYAIVIDGNITLATISNASGGGFTVPNTLSGTRTITANLVGGTAALLTCSHTTGNTVAVVGNVTGGSGAACYGLRNSSTGLITVTGNILGGGNSSAYGVHNSSTGTVNVTGNSTGATATGTYNNAGGTINLTGNAYGSATAAAYGVHNASTGPVNITGSTFGGAASSSYGTYNPGSGTVTISADATGGSANIAWGVFSTGGLVIVYRAIGGTYYTASGVGCFSATPSRVTVMQWGATGVAPVTGFVSLVDSPTLNKATVALVGGGTRDLVVSAGGGGGAVIGSPIVRGAA